MEASTDANYRKSLAATMGVNVFLIGAHRAHSEVLRRFNLNGKKDRYYHNEQTYPGYEEGILSCIKTFSEDNAKGGYKRKAGSFKEAIDAEKQALHANYALQIRNYTNAQWSALEEYIYSTRTNK